MVGFSLISVGVVGIIWVACLTQVQ